MPFSEIFGQEHAIGLIKKSVSRKRIPQAWLFTGQKNIGKFKTSIALAQQLNCKKNTEDACGKCDYCIQIFEQNFLDLQVLSPEGKHIKINQIRQSLHWLALHNDQSKIKVMILDGAQNLSREAANALLKTLEEPSPNTLIILIAESIIQLQETIVSRCQQVRFRPLTDQISKKILSEKTDLNIEKVRLLSAFGMGSVKTNLALRIELVEKVQTIAIGWLSDFSVIKLEEILYTCENWGKSKNEEWSIYLDFLETWFRDLSMIKLGYSEDRLINNLVSSSGNRITSLRKCSLFFNIDQIQEIFFQIGEVRRSVEFNANKSLAVESLSLLIYRSTL